MCGTHIVLYDLLDPGYGEDEDEWDQRGVATGRRYIRDLLMKEVRGRARSEIIADGELSELKVSLMDHRRDGKKQTLAVTASDGGQGILF